MNEITLRDGGSLPVTYKDGRIVLPANATELQRQDVLASIQHDIDTFFGVVK